MVGGIHSFSAMRERRKEQETSTPFFYFCFSVSLFVNSKMSCRSFPSFLSPLRMRSVHLSLSPSQTKEPSALLTYAAHLVLSLALLIALTLQQWQTVIFLP